MTLARPAERGCPANPYGTSAAREHSTYSAFQENRVVHTLNPSRDVSPLEEFVHDSFRAHVLNPKFSCVGAKSAFHRNTYRFGLYDGMNLPDATAGLAHDLWAFVQEQTSLGGDFTTFVASFTDAPAASEEEFEQRLWTQLQALHEMDRDVAPYDTSVSADPQAENFAFSFAGRAFYVVGLHPAASRWTRRFAWPTLVFNAHFQFEHLKEAGKYTPLQETIRGRERALQGGVNAMLSEFGERSEARQYSGRAVDDEWRCPFQAASEGRS